LECGFFLGHVRGPLIMSINVCLFIFLFYSVNVHFI